MHRLKLIKKTNYSITRGLAFRLIAVILAFFLAGVSIALADQNPFLLASRIIKGTFFTSYGREQLLILATPLILLGTAFTLAGRVHLINVGLDGQLSIGAFAAAAVGLHISVPSLPGLLIIIIAGAIGGALYALFPLWLLMKLGISEILTTLMLNFVALKWAEYIGRSAWTDKSLGGTTANATPRILYQLPMIYGDLHIGIILALFIVGVLWYIQNRTHWGYELTSINANPRAAQNGGIRVIRYTIFFMAFSGALAGLAGVIDLTSVSHRFSAYLSPGYGWLGISVGILAAGSYPAIIFWSLFLALLQNGGIVLKTAGLSPAIVGAITGLILVLVSVSEVLANYRLLLINDTKDGISETRRKDEAPSQ